MCLVTSCWISRNDFRRESALKSSQTNASLARSYQHSAYGILYMLANRDVSLQVVGVRVSDETKAKPTATDRC